MSAIAFLLELRRSRTLLVSLAVVTGLYAGFITVFYTNVAENATAFEDLLKLYPKELMVAFGIEGNFADPAVFLSGYVFNFLWPLMGAIAAIVLATRVAADADRGFLDIALATPVRRGRHLLASIGTQVVGVVVLAVTWSDRSSSAICSSSRTSRPATSSCRCSRRSPSRSRSRARRPSSRWSCSIADERPESRPGSSSRCTWST